MNHRMIPQPSIAAILVALALISAACGSAVGDADPISTPADQIAETSFPPESNAGTQEVPTSLPATEASPEDGITVEEAEEFEVLAGTFDALLVGPEFAEVNTEGCLEVQFTLTNVGSSADTYSLNGGETVDKIEPEEIALESRESKQLIATVCDAASNKLSLSVYSRGLNDLIAQYESK